jgi:UDP-glucuronate decarboxylase
MNAIIKNDINEVLLTNLDWSYFSGKTVLISGASGMLASYLVYTLLQLNTNKMTDKPVKVIGLVRNLEYANKKFFSINSNFFNLIEKDLSKEIDISLDVDVIIHTASHASPKFYNTDPVGTMMPNIVGTMNLLELARKKQVDKFLFFSSGEIYGHQDSRKSSISEDDYGRIDYLNIRSCYAVSKIAGEVMCISYGHQYDIDVKIVRPFHTYGPGMKLDDGRVFADFVNNIVNNENIKIKSNGLQKRSFCYISDATAGFFYVLLNGDSNVAYNIANPYQDISIRELADVLVALFPHKDLKVLMLNEHQEGCSKSAVKEQLPDITLLKKLGWQESVSIQEGFKRVVKSFS